MTRAPTVEGVHVNVGGFSAGVFQWPLCIASPVADASCPQTSGKLGGIAVPPVLLSNIFQKQGKQLLFPSYYGLSLQVAPQR